MAVPVYLYTGPEFGERNDAVEKLRAAVKKQHTAVDEYLFYATETPVADIVTLLQSESLFTDATFIVYRAAEVIKKKEDVDFLLAWIQSAPRETAVLVLVSNEIAIDKKITAAIPAAHKTVFWEMFENRKVPWLKKYFSDNGYVLSDAAAETVLELVEHNTQALRAECARFFAVCPPGATITAEIAERLLEHNREESAFTLFAAMATPRTRAEQRLETALEILQKIRMSKNTASVMILAGLASCFRRLSLWHAVHHTGAANNDVLRAHGFTNKKAHAQYAAAASLWTAGQTTAIRARIAAADMAIRSGGALMEYTILSELLIEIIIKKGAACATYESEFACIQQ
ncbi:MAG: DNA polymerase III subunit delta [Treponema sp.]|nr:DNA polymerase III subunit delta [Treponema sp.]